METKANEEIETKTGAKTQNAGDGRDKWGGFEKRRTSLGSRSGPAPGPKHTPRP